MLVRLTVMRRFDQENAEKLAAFKQQLIRDSKRNRWSLQRFGKRYRQLGWFGQNQVDEETGTQDN